MATKFFRLKKWIRVYVVKTIANLLDDILQEHSARKIIKYDRKHNVSIHASFYREALSDVYITGDPKKLVIKENVACRKFCSFLMFPGASLIIGSNVFFNNGCSINCLGSIDIGDNSIFGEGVKIYDHNHAYHYENGILKFEREKFTIGSVKIGKNCWIGSGVTILNNVEIGDNVIIGANNLIYKSIPSNTIVKATNDYLISAE